MNTRWMRIGGRFFAAGLALGMLGTPSSLASEDAPIVFEDVSGPVGIAEHVHGWVKGHGGAWGDLTGDGRPDLYIGAFAAYPEYKQKDAPIPNMLFLNRGDRFEFSGDMGVRLDRAYASTSMALFVDLNNNGRLDLFVGTHNTRGEGPPSQIFANTWPDDLRNVTDDIVQWPRNLHVRNATAIDLDQDGLLDLVLIDGRYGGREQSVVALRNLGGFQFEDVSDAYGFPRGATRGLGSAVGDVNNNGRLDLFVADANRMFISQTDGAYTEYRPGFFRVAGLSRDDWPCGAAFADLTGNGLLDMVLTIHGNRIPGHLGHVFIYVNRGIDEHGMPQFEDVTDAAGLRGFRLPRRTGDLRQVAGLNVRGDAPVNASLRAAQVALIDLNHNGRRDILLSMIREDEHGRLQPVVLRHVGVTDGVPRFEYPPLRSIVGYHATAPIADYDRDGRIDIFMASWSADLTSQLFRNVTEAGNYLVVRVRGQAAGLNSMGIGATVRLYEAGHAGDAGRLLGRGDITIGNGYSSGDEAMAHFGLGRFEACDVVVTWQGHQVTRGNVPVNQYLEVVVGDEP